MNGLEVGDVVVTKSGVRYRVSLISKKGLTLHNIEANYPSALSWDMYRDINLTLNFTKDTQCQLWEDDHAS